MKSMSEIWAQDQQNRKGAGPMIDLNSYIEHLREELRLAEEDGLDHWIGSANMELTRALEFAANAAAEKVQGEEVADEDQSAAVGSSGIQFLSHEEFWALDPAPETEFIEVTQNTMFLIGDEIDVEVDDPANAVMVGMGPSSGTKTAQGIGSTEEFSYAVLKWGSWETPENRKIRALRDEARRLMAEEEAAEQAEHAKLAEEGES